MLGALVLMLISAGATQAQQLPPDLVSERWQTEDGLPHNAVTALLQARDGYLWVGTAAGLARFDGLRFVPVATAAPHLSYSYIWALHAEGDTLWVGSGDGLTRLADGRSTTFTTADGLPVDFVRALARDGGGRLWIGTYGGGVCRYDARFVCFGLDDGLPGLSVSALQVDPNGALWVATDDGLARWTGDRFTTERAGDATALATDDAGVRWLGTSEGLFRRGDGWTPVRDGTEPLGAVRALLPDEAGLWIGTEANGLFRYRDGALDRFADVEADDIRALLPDREGNVWVGTNGGGLVRLRHGRARVLGVEEGLPSEVVNAVLEDRAGRVWLATSDGLARLDGDAVLTFTTADGLPAERVFSLAEGTDGALWIGTNGGGVARLTDGRFTTFTAADGLPGDVIFGLFADRSGQVWAGGQGLARWTGARFETVTDPGLADGLIVTFAESPDGTLWFGSADAGLSRYRDGRFTTFTKADGLPSDAIRALHVGEAGTLWIGTRGGGLVRFRDDTFESVSVAHGLPDPIVFGLLADDRGMLWMNTARAGIVRVEKAELDAVMRGEAERVTPLVLGRADGLRSLEGVGGFHPSGWRAADGRLWFPTHRGVAVVDPARITADPTPPPVYIEEVLVDDEPVPVRDGSLRLGPGADRIEIRYSGLHFADPERVRFRYRLGPDEPWRDAGTRRSRTYDNLAPGRYTFEVAAANPDGVWNATPAVLALTVVPPWWRAPWALGLWALVLGGGFYAFVRWRVWTLRQQNEALEVLVAARTSQVEAQAEQLRDLDRAKSRFFANLSHEFRTPLTLLLGPIETMLDRAEAPEDLRLLRGMQTQSRRLLRLVGQLLDLSKLDAGAVALHAQPGDLVAFLRRLTASFASLAEQRGVTLGFQAEDGRVDAAFDPEKLEQIVGNLLSNALKFTPEGGKVQVGLEVGGSEAVVQVRDTGTGIEPDALERVFDRFYQTEAASDGLGTGIGLALARDLAELHGGSLSAESTVGFGSVFTLRLPLDLVADEEKQGASAAAPNAGWDLGDDGEEEDRFEPDTLPDDAPLVLLVEDHAEVRAFLRHTLAARYRIAEADSGEAGLETARATPPDLIVSDVMMPGLDGFDFVRALRADEALAPVPVILLTARADDASRLEGLGAGADDYLAKPFSAAELKVRVENLIELRRALRRRYSGEVVVGPTRVAVPSADAVFLDEVRATVEQHIGNAEFGVEWLADAVHLSRRQLHRKLRALTGLSTVAFIRMMRLERAAQLLEQASGGVAEVAYAVGFRDADYFARLFKQAYGHPPSEHAERAASAPPTDRT